MVILDMSVFQNETENIILLTFIWAFPQDILHHGHVKNKKQPESADLHRA